MRDEQVFGYIDVSEHKVKNRSHRDERDEHERARKSVYAVGAVRRIDRCPQHDRTHDHVYGDVHRNRMRDERQPKIDTSVDRCAFGAIKKQQRFGKTYDKVEQRFAVFAPARRAFVVEKSREHHNPCEYKRAAL